MTRPLTILMPIYAGVTHLDFTGPHQFFALLPDTVVIVASVDARPVAARGLTFSELADLAAIDTCDVLCVPGGSGCVEAIEDAVFVGHIRRLAATARYVTSVCTGSLILGAAGLLFGRRAACHWAWRDLLSLFGAIPDDGRIVRDGNRITGGGVTAGIDFALAVIAEIAGSERAEAIQLALEYAPSPPFSSGRPETASTTVLQAVSGSMAPALVDYRVRLERVAARMA